MKLTEMIKKILRPILGWEARDRFKRFWTGRTDVPWVRVVMDQETQKLLRDLDLKNMDVLEISGSLGTVLGELGSYRRVDHPEFDICEVAVPERYDLILAEQIFEHLLWPYRAGKNVFEMLKPGGYFFVSTPFLVAIHRHPHDCTRWTETGMKHLLAECGFPLDEITTGSWGNRSCVMANFEEFVPYRSRLHSLENEWRFPVSVWALAKKGAVD